MIPEYLLAKIEKSDVIYRCIGNEMKNGILACGFMRKETADRSGGKSGPASAGCAAFHMRRSRWEMAGIFYLDWETVF